MAPDDRPSELRAELAARIRRRGPLPFAEMVEAALYDPESGFYASGGHAGRRGDFITSPEVGPLFGAVLGRYLDEVWRELGEPDPFVVVEAGAGVGTLARTVLEGAPACLPALTYVLVEQSAVLRERHRDHLDIADPALAFPPPRPDDDGAAAPGEAAAAQSERDQGRGPRFVSLAELPAMTVVGVVLANELLDNLPFDVVERLPQGWGEVRVGLDADDTSLVECVVPVTDDLADLAQRAAAGVEAGVRVPVQRAARAWVADALGRLRAGRLLVVDYGADTATLADRGVDGWLRTYRDQQRGAAPLVDLGEQDITVDVAFDQVTSQHAPTRVWTQAEFLGAHGIDELVVEGRRIWDERAGIGDLAAIKARSRVREAEALTDPDGLGAFTAVEWRRG